MTFPNPYRPGAGHKPPYLAGRKNEKNEFSRLLKQTEILENFIITGLRGVGKTVLLEELKPLAQNEGWTWLGSDLSETVSVSEDNLAIRLLTDLSVLTSRIPINITQEQTIGFTGDRRERIETLNFNALSQLYSSTPGLVTDKLRHILEVVYSLLPEGKKRLIFAYDEAQNLADNAAKDQFPLSVMLDVFQSIQRKNIPFMLVLVGLPTLFPKLVDARTFSERMFRVMFLDSLSESESKEAIKKPLDKADCPVRPTENSVEQICNLSGGYPYFIQFICREVYDIWIEDNSLSIPVEDISNKLDTDFFAGRWNRVTDRQKQLLSIIAVLPTSGDEFSIQEISQQSNEFEKPFSNSQVNQMLSNLSDKGLIYKNRHGKYSFAVPLLDRFIRRQIELGYV